MPDRDRGNGGRAPDSGGTKAPEGAGTGLVAGGVLGGLAGWLVGVGALTIPGVGPFIAAGALGTALLGAAVGSRGWRRRRRHRRCPGWHGHTRRRSKGVRGRSP